MTDPLGAPAEIEKVETAIKVEEAKPDPDPAWLARLESKLDKLLGTPIAPAPTADPTPSDEPPAVEPDAAPPAVKKSHGASKRWFGGGDDE